MKFKREFVTLSDRDRQPWVSVKALTRGAFAIHPHVSAQSVGGYHVLTHRPTGAQLATAYQQKNLRRLVAQLDAFGLDWEFSGTMMPDEIREKAAPVIRAFNSDTSN